MRNSVFGLNWGIPVAAQAVASIVPCRGRRSGSQWIGGAEFRLSFGRGFGTESARRKASGNSSELRPGFGRDSPPIVPERPAQMARGAQELVPDDRGRAFFVPGTAVAADGYDGIGVSVDDRVMAAARVMGTIRGDAGDLFPLGNLRQPFRQQRAVPLTARSERDCAYVACRGVHGDGTFRHRSGTRGHACGSAIRHRHGP